MISILSLKKISEYRTTIIWMACTIGILFMLLLMFKVDLSSKILTYTSYISNQNEEQFIHDFTSGMEIRQKFSCYKEFDFITLSFSHHDTAQQGKLGIQVIDSESGESLIYKEKSMTDVYYNVPEEISFVDIGGGKANKMYEVVLFSSGTGETALGVYGYTTDNQTAVVNGEMSEYALSIGVHSYTNIYWLLTFIILGIATLAVLAVIIGAFECRLKEQNIFLLLAVPFAICMLLMWPGNSVYDETRHYHTVYNYSNILLGYGDAENIMELQMRKCDIIDEKVKEGLGTPINSQAQCFGYYMPKMMQRTESKEMVLVDISSVPVVQNGTFLEYLPSTLGMTLGRLLGFNYYWMATLTRIANIACYILLCYYAIFKIPVLKSLIVLLAALPMNLYQTSGISYDGLTFGIGIVVFAFIIKLWIDRLSKKDWMIFALSAFALGNCKGGVYLTLLLLMCFIPKDRYKEKKWIKIAGVIFMGGIAMLSSFAPTFMRWFGLGGNSSPIVNSVETVGGRLHLAYMFQKPLEFIHLLVLTLIENADMYLGQMLGYRTAWANATISMAVMFPFLVLLILAAVKTSDKDFEIGFKARLGILGILLIEIVGMHAIFLVDTSIYSNIIVGCQGRYFILFIPCILLLFRNNGLVFKEKREYLYPMFSMAQLVYLYFFLEMFMCA